MHTTDAATDEAPILRQRLLTLPEAARYLGCTLWSVRELIWKGRVPYTRFGKRFQVDVRDLDELVEREKRCEGTGDGVRACAHRVRKFGGASPSNGAQTVNLHEEPEDETSEHSDKKQRAKVGV